MPGFLVQAGAKVSCPHGGQVNVLPTQPRVRAGQPAGLVTAPSPVVGCPFQIPTPAGPKPQPCVRVQWTSGTLRVRATGQPLLVQSSTGLCLSAEQIPQGAPLIILTQVRVKGQ